MTQNTKEKWLACTNPVVSDTIRWREPLWAKPTKARGKRDKIGEQMVTAELLAVSDELAELKVINVKRLSLAEDVTDEPLSIKTNDVIRRKASSILNGDCEKLEQEA